MCSIVEHKFDYVSTSAVLRVTALGGGLRWILYALRCRRRFRRRDPCWRTLPGQPDRQSFDQRGWVRIGVCWDNSSRRPAQRGYHDSYRRPDSNRLQISVVLDSQGPRSVRSSARTASSSTTRPAAVIASVRVGSHG